MWVQGLLFLPAAQAVFPGVKPVLWGWRWGKYGGSAPQGWGGETPHPTLKQLRDRKDAGRSTSYPE